MSNAAEESAARPPSAEAASPKSSEPENCGDEPTTICELTTKIIEADEDPLLKVYREQDEIDTDSDSDESDIVIQPAALEEEVNEDDPRAKKFGLTVKGELTLDDLPPVEKLHISLPIEELEQIGEVFSFVDRLLVVESSKAEPVLNLETVLFLEDGRAVGQIFDVIGPVKKPYYVLRFNNPQEIRDEHLERGVKMFCAPTRVDYTFFVFEKQIKEMMKLRGSDASWEYDLEPPEHELEYSDDEQERDAKRERRAKRQADGNPVKAEGSRPPTRREFCPPRAPQAYFTAGPAPPPPRPPPSGPPGFPGAAAAHYYTPHAVPHPNPYAVAPPMFHANIPPPGYNPWAHPRMTMVPMNYTLPPTLVRNNNNQLCYYKYIGQ